MAYKRFLIRNYRGIKELGIDLSKESLMPIIGVNECGKTTILNAIYSFDYMNDGLNEGAHLKNCQNLFSPKPSLPFIWALLTVAESVANASLKYVEEKHPEFKEVIKKYRRSRKKISGDVWIGRNLVSKHYDFDIPEFSNKSVNDLLARRILLNAPYILYFDDFRDSVDEIIEIKDAKSPEKSGWLQIMERLFSKAEAKVTPSELAGLDERLRKTVLSKVTKFLNATLTTEWQNFQLEDSAALRINIDFISNIQGGAQKNFLKLDLVEVDSNEEEHYFHIRDRSKGFFWFFNFVMKLEFNPKVAGSAEYDSVYLLDEPGSYLHASAQNKLCKKLKGLSQKNRVVFCTHSHYLLDPELIPTNSIRIAQKNQKGEISIANMHEYAGGIESRRAAFQPLYDALQLKPFLHGFDKEKVVLVEGVVDFMAFTMFLGGELYLPSVGANSLKYLISLLLAWGCDFKALWDLDKEGNIALADATKHFGIEFSKRHFRQLAIADKKRKKVILQDLFADGDLPRLRSELGLNSNAPFSTTITALFYSDRRGEILGHVSERTKSAFQHMRSVVWG